MTVYFDFETGGLLDHHPNIQLAAIAIDDNWAELATFERKIRFGEAMADPEALRMNHYDAEVWRAEALPEHRVVDEFTQFLDRFKSEQFISKRTGRPYSVAKLAGHNAATFDGPRLRKMYGERFLPADPRIRDTVQLAMWICDAREVKPDNFKLETLCKFFGIEIPTAHDALCDVRATISLARALSLSGRVQSAA